MAKAMNRVLVRSGLYQTLTTDWTPPAIGMALITRS